MNKKTEIKNKVARFGKKKIPPATLRVTLLNIFYILFVYDFFERKMSVIFYLLHKSEQNSMTILRVFKEKVGDSSHFNPKTI